MFQLVNKLFPIVREYDLQSVRHYTLLEVVRAVGLSYDGGSLPGVSRQVLADGSGTTVVYRHPKSQYALYRFNKGSHTFIKLERRSGDEAPSWYYVVEIKDGVVAREQCRCDSKFVTDELMSALDYMFTTIGVRDIQRGCTLTA